MQTDILRVENLSKHFGGLVALDCVSFHVVNSEIMGIIGPNGAGKTTLLNAISGFHVPTSGKVTFDDMDITGWKAHSIAQLGIGRNFQASNILFMELSVIENVFAAFHKLYNTKVWQRFACLPCALKEERVFHENAIKILEFMGMDSVKDELAKNLPHGYQRILSVCIALATSPKLLLLDEPVTGMNQTEVNSMVGLIRQIRTSGITIIIIEHNIETIMNLCDRIVVLNHGAIIAKGYPKEIQENEEVIEAYLGKE